MLAAIPGGESGKERFQQAAIGVCMNPSIANCTPESVFSAIYACARLNLIPDPVLHHVAIVPFRNTRGGTTEATMIVEYRGLVELAKRANPNLTIKAATVYENDVYRLIEGTTDELVVQKRWWEAGHKEPGDALFHYCVSRQPETEPILVILPAIEARKIGNASKAGSRPGTPWHDHPDRMGEKTAIRRSERFWQMDPEKDETKRFRLALEHDERSDEMPDVPLAEGDGADLGDMGQHPEQGQRTTGGGQRKKKKVTNRAKAKDADGETAEEALPKEQAEAREESPSPTDSPMTPAEYLIDVWARERDVSLEDAAKAVERLCQNRWGCAPGMAQQADVDLVVGQIMDGEFRCELYEKG